MKHNATSIIILTIVEIPDSILISMSLLVFFIFP